MFQPFEIFQTKLIARLRGINKRYLVSQTYARGVDTFDEIKKTSILLSDYDDLGTANIHLNAVKHDKYAAIIDLENEKHRNKLEEMLLRGSPYKLYWSIVMKPGNVKARIDMKYKDQIRRYIMNNTDWRISRDTQVVPKLEVTFGELFITLKHGTQVRRVKFEEIESS